jgi:hypothetical protein
MKFEGSIEECEQFAHLTPAEAISELCKHDNVWEDMEDASSKDKKGDGPHFFVQHIPPGAAGTMDLNSQRIRVWADADGGIRRITVG